MLGAVCQFQLSECVCGGFLWTRMWMSSFFGIASQGFPPTLCMKILGMLVPQTRPTPSYLRGLRSVDPWQKKRKSTCTAALVRDWSAGWLCGCVGRGKSKSGSSNIIVRAPPLDYIKKQNIWYPKKMYINNSGEYILPANLSGLRFGWLKMLINLFFFFGGSCNASLGSHLSCLIIAEMSVLFAYRILNKLLHSCWHTSASRRSCHISSRTVN